MRAATWRWFQTWDGNPEELLARYDELWPYERMLCVRRMGAPYREEALRCILCACYQVMPAKHPNALAQNYSPRQLMAVIALRWWMGVWHAAALTHLREHEPERYLIFGRDATMPTHFSLRNFENGLSVAQWRLFLLALADINLGAAKTIWANRSQPLVS